MMQASKHDSSEDIAFQLLSAAKKAGADDADVLVAEGVSTNVEVRNATLELAERSEGIDLGLRVFLGKKQAIVSGSDGRPETIAAMAERAIAMAKEAPDDPYCGLAQPEDFAKDWDIAAYDLYDPRKNQMQIIFNGRLANWKQRRWNVRVSIKPAMPLPVIPKARCFLLQATGFRGAIKEHHMG